MREPSVKLGLFLPAGLHDQMLAIGGPGPPARGAIQAAYVAAFEALLRALDAGVEVVFAAVRGPKRRVTVRLPEPLCARIRAVLAQLNLKITDLACAAIQRHLAASKGG